MCDKGVLCTEFDFAEHAIREDGLDHFFDPDRPANWCGVHDPAAKHDQSWIELSSYANFKGLEYPIGFSIPLVDPSLSRSPVLDFRKHVRSIVVPIGDNVNAPRGEASVVGADGVAEVFLPKCPAKMGAHLIVPISIAVKSYDTRRCPSDLLLTVHCDDAADTEHSKDRQWHTPSTRLGMRLFGSTMEPECNRVIYHAPDFLGLRHLDAMRHVHYGLENLLIPVDDRYHEGKVRGVINERVGDHWYLVARDPLSHFWNSSLPTRHRVGMGKKAIDHARVVSKDDWNASIVPAFSQKYGNLHLALKNGSALTIKHEFADKSKLADAVFYIEIRVVAIVI